MINQIYLIFGKIKACSFSCLPPWTRMAIVFALAFAVLIPITEWPDAITNISRSADGSKFYPTHALEILSMIDQPKNIQFTFFSDKLLYTPKLEYLIANFIRLPIVLLMIIVLCKLAQKSNDYILPLAPPLVFSLCSPSQESIAVFILLSAFFISGRDKVITALLCMLSVTLDRSMAPNAFFLALITISPHLRLLATSPKWAIPISFILIFLTQKYHAIHIFNNAHFSELSFLGISHWDVAYNSSAGKYNLYALASSLMGLYGSMSIRPFPFWLYYPAIAFLFILGFLSSSWSRRSMFLSLLLISYMTMWLLPPISQARYYPLLALSFWSIIFSGIEFIKMSPIKIYVAIFFSTVAGCLAGLLESRISFY